MNIHEAVLQPMAAFVYCNRQAAAGRRRHTKVGNFRAPAGACAAELRPSRSIKSLVLVGLPFDGPHMISY